MGPPSLAAGLQLVGELEEQVLVVDDAQLPHVGLGLQLGRGRLQLQAWEWPRNGGNGNGGMGMGKRNVGTGVWQWRGCRDGDGKMEDGSRGMGMWE